MNHCPDTGNKQLAPCRVSKVNRNKIKVTHDSVTGDKTTYQRQQDQLVLSNRFQMLANLVDKQEQNQQIPHVSLGSVTSPIGTKNVQKGNIVKILNMMPILSQLMINMGYC